MDEGLLVYIFSVAGLMLLSAFFSGSETGLTAVSRAKIHKLKLEGDKRAKIVSDLREKKEDLIGAILLGNNAVNILASALATSVAISLFGEQGVAYATFCMTALVLIFAEVLPKTYAFNHAEKVALFVAPFFLIFVKVFAPIVKSVQVVVNMSLKLFGAEKHSDELISAMDSLRGAIDLHHGEGGVEKAHRVMLDGILDLAETEISEVLIHRKNIFSCDIDKPTGYIIDRLLSGPHSRLALWKDNPENIVGVLHIKTVFQILRDPNLKIDEMNINDHMVKPWFIPETTKLLDQLNAFTDQGSHIAFVVDEYGDLEGIVTLSDIIEEVVGNVSDEYDKKYKPIETISEGVYRIRGDITLRDLNREMDWNFSDDEATTLAGYLIHHAEIIPEIGDSFMIDGFEFTVNAKKKNQITSIKVRQIIVDEE